MSYRRFVLPCLLLGLACLLLPADAARSDEDVQALKARIRILENNLAVYKDEVRSLETMRANMVAEINKLLQAKRVAQSKACELEAQLKAEQQRHTKDVAMLQQELAKVHTQLQKQVVALTQAQQKRALESQAMAELLADIGEPAVPALLRRLERGSAIPPRELVAYLQGMGAKARKALPKLKALADSAQDEKLAVAANDAVVAIEDTIKR